MGNGNLSLVDLVSDGERGRREPSDIQVLEFRTGEWFVSADDGYSYMGIDGVFYPSMTMGDLRSGGHWFSTQQDARDAVSRFYPQPTPQEPVAETSPAPDRTKMPVADLAREMAALVPDNWVLKSNLTDFANSVFLELPEARSELLQRVAEIINHHAKHSSAEMLSKSPWPELKAVFLSAFGEPK